MRNVVVVVGAAGALVLAACSGETRPLPSTTPSTSSSPASSAVSSSSGSSVSAADLDSALLTARDVGSDFVVRPTFEPVDDAPPCTPGAEPLFDTIAPRRQSQITVQQADGPLVVAETLAVYDTDDAERIVASAVDGYDCSSAVVGGQRFAITPRSVPPSNPDVEAVAWDFTNAEQRGTAAVLRVDGKLASMTLIATAATAAELDVPQVLARAAQKLAALP